MGISDWYFTDFYGDIDERLMPLTRMWAMDDFRKQWAREDRKRVPFDFADQVLCLLGLQHLWWGELAGIYYSVDLRRPSYTRPVPKDKIRCAAEGCSEIFIPKRKDHRFCCQRCLRAQWHRDNKGHKTLLNKRTDKCPKGHDRSPENVVYEKNYNGVMALRCRACKREKQQARRARLATA